MKIKVFLPVALAQMVCINKTHFSKIWNIEIFLRALQSAKEHAVHYVSLLLCNSG